MKKIILIAICAAVLALAGVGGGVYASHGHGQETANKLIGFGVLGSIQTGGESPYFHSYFGITNPDPVNSIEITKISVFKGDGTTVYEGPLTTGQPGTRVPVTEPLQPHEQRAIVLYDYMYLGGDTTDPASWLTTAEAFAAPVAAYTVEVHWRPVSRAATCSLIGWEHTGLCYSPPTETGIPNHIFGDMRSATVMVNVSCGSGQ